MPKPWWTWQLLSKILCFKPAFLNKTWHLLRLSLQWVMCSTHFRSTSKRLQQTSNKYNKMMQCAYFFYTSPEMAGSHNVIKAVLVCGPKLLKFSLFFLDLFISPIHWYTQRQDTCYWDTCMYSAHVHVHVVHNCTILSVTNKCLFTCTTFWGATHVLHMYLHPSGHRICLQPYPIHIE